MNDNTFRWHRSVAAVALLILICGTPLRAWCGDSNLWVSLNGAGIESYTSGQLKQSGMPTPIHLSTFNSATGLAFDKSKNLWAVVDGDEVVRFTAAQLKNLKTNPSPTPGVIITSTSTFINLIGCNFDRRGNLWVVDSDNGSIYELSKAQLAVGSGDITPAVMIYALELGFPTFVTFDEAGNAWVAHSGIAEFSASQLKSSGTKSPAVLLTDDGSGTTVDLPGEIAFDRHGNLWFPNYYAETVVEYAKGQLATSGGPVPKVKLSSAVLNGPWGTAFDHKGDLVVMNLNDGTIAKFAAKQLKVSGAPIPKVAVTGTQTNNYQITFGPAF